MKESAFRPGEAHRLTSEDINLERRITTLNKPAKYSKPKQFRMSEKLTSMIAPFVSKAEPSELIWEVNQKSMGRTFYSTRKRLSEKLNNPKLMKINLLRYSPIDELFGYINIKHKVHSRLHPEILKIVDHQLRLQF